MHRALSGLVHIVSKNNDQVQVSHNTGQSLTRRHAEKATGLLPTITIQEVEAANHPSKAWVVIRGKVYDMTKFADKHPGGRDLLLLAVGRDATAMFESMHSDKNARVLQKYLIGHLKETNVPQFSAKSDFAIEIEKKVSHYFAEKAINPRDAPGMLIIYGFLGFAFLLSYMGMFSAQVSSANFLLPWVSAVVNGWTAAMMGFYYCHDGCHGAYSSSPRTWTFLQRLYESFTGLSTIIWFYQHGMGHHPFTNVIGMDPDILSEEVNVLCIHDDQPWRNYYRLQKYYWLPLYSQLIQSRKLTEWKNVFYDQQFKNIHINPVSRSQKFWALTTMIIYSLHHFVAPLVIFNISILRLLALHTIIDITWSLYLCLIFQASHVNNEVAWPKPDANGNINSDWAKLQVESSMDFAHNDFWVTFLCGSLNYQAVHHLFPYVSQWHYPALAPIVKETCAKHGVRYNYKENIWGMLRAHVHHIRFFAMDPALR